MADKQESHLNGAFYGPAIPPPKSHHRPRRRSSNCGCCCLLSLLLKIIITLIVLIGIAILIFWLVVRPNKVKFHVTDVRLNELEYFANNSTQSYDLAVNITIRNPNKKIKIYYDVIEARATYHNRMLPSIYLPKFLQGHKSTNVLSPHYKGNQSMFLTPSEVEFYDKEKASGIYTLDLDLYMKVRLRLGDIVTGSFKPLVKCDLKVPLKSPDGRLADGSETSKCDLKIFR
ncbi:protein YLS9-like [Tripterygium wilfordii]|uniref:Protein YLS9-like n=1 Tax=Tripterygium wilfordii TaxID=458696 RepID=A0A7J7BWM8_TRIWF|nr:NDR1/HIN1-like protein 10 [Tripterygium wilfordii]KAF5725936.1 protein YLS9-like [Tripterygium wilfordii]